MATLPADEDYAKALLAILGAENMRPGQSLGANRANAAFLSKGMGRAADYEAALKYAVEQHWVTLECGMVRLTKVGFAEM